jgi:hypothetical protein
MQARKHLSALNHKQLWGLQLKWLRDAAITIFHPHRPVIRTKTLPVNPSKEFSLLSHKMEVTAVAPTSKGAESQRKQNATGSNTLAAT